MNKPLESLSADKQQYVRTRTDKYFSKTREIVEKFGDRAVTYGVFLRRGVLCAVNPAIEVLRQYYPAGHGSAAFPLKVTRLYEEARSFPTRSRCSPIPVPSPRSPSWRPWCCSARVSHACARTTPTRWR